MRGPQGDGRVPAASPETAPLSLLPRPCGAVALERLELPTNLLMVLIPVLMVVVAHHTFTTIYLMQVLGRAFDPFWKRRMFVPANTFGQRYQWTLYYSGAVISQTVRRTIFENIPYDFRGRVSRTTVIVCLLHSLAGVVIALGLLVLAAYGVWGLWSLWANLPRPVPSVLGPEELIGTPPPTF